MLHCLFRPFAVARCLVFILALPLADGAAAQVGTPEPALTDTMHRTRIGYGRLLNNDLWGDTQDRWHTGSFSSSRVWGYSWQGQLPSQLGELLELRLHGEIMAPANLEHPKANDRPYAAALSVGLHSHAEFAGIETAVGADLVVIGPQNGLSHFHEDLHSTIGSHDTDTASSTQIGNTIRPTLVAEFGHTFELSDKVFLRPFLEARAGDETLVRVGADMSIGRIGQGELLVRDKVTGQRYRTIYNADPGLTFILGGDIGYVSESVYLPEDRGYEMLHDRHRIRAGLHWQGDASSVFYGVTYMSEEFSTQSEGQVVGSLRLKLRF